MNKFKEDLKPKKRKVKYRMYVCGNKGYLNEGYAHTLKEVREHLQALKGYEKYMIIECDITNNSEFPIELAYYNNLTKEKGAERNGD